jgi:uncharacterized protein (DUF58 family)
VLTGRGVALLGAGVVLVASGLGFGYPELTVLGCGALAAFAGALLWAVWRPRLEVRREVQPDRITRGEPCTAVVHVRNAARWRGASLIGHDQVGSATVTVPLLRLGRGKQTSTSYPIPTERRGVVDVGPLRIARRDPLDLVRATQEYGDPVRVWVHPRVHPIHTVPVGTARSLDGLVDKVAHGSITFHALREYVAGDDLRHVHWRTSAHVGELMVREHVDTSLPRIVVFLDDRASVQTEEGFEHAVEAAASVLVAVLHAGLNVDLHLASGTVLASAAAGHGTRAFLDALAEATLGGGSGLDEAAQRLRHRRVGDTLIAFSGAADQGALEAIAALRDVYPSIVLGLIGHEQASTTTMAGLLVLAATDGADFATAWDGVSAW